MNSSATLMASHKLKGDGTYAEAEAKADSDYLEPVAAHYGEHQYADAEGAAAGSNYTEIVRVLLFWNRVLTQFFTCGCYGIARLLGLTSVYV
jgi:hypothetical protein